MFRVRFTTAERPRKGLKTSDGWVYKMKGCKYRNMCVEVFCYKIGKNMTEGTSL